MSRKFPEGENFGPFLKAWRKEAELTQASLAEETNITTRNISFFENGHSRPSRQMVKRIANALDLNDQAYMELLRAAGYASDNLAVADIDEYKKALDEAITLKLNKQNPLPAMVLNRRYEVTHINQGCKITLDHLFGRPFDDSRLPVSLFDILFNLESAFNYMSTNEASAKFYIQRIHREQFDHPEAEGLIKHYQKRYPQVPTEWWVFQPDYQPSPTTKMQFQSDGKSYEIISVISSLGSPHDLGGNITRLLETFPANKETRAFYQALWDSATRTNNEC